jgi:hypothetical protein
MGDTFTATFYSKALIYQGFFVPFFCFQHRNQQKAWRAKVRFPLDNAPCLFNLGPGHYRSANGLLGLTLALPPTLARASGSNVQIALHQPDLRQLGRRELARIGAELGLDATIPGHLGGVGLGVQIALAHYLLDFAPDCQRGAG